MFEFAWPWVFLLLPAPLLIYGLVSPMTQLIRTALRVPFYQSLTQIQGAVPTITGKLKRVLLMLIWLLLITAAAGPQWVGTPQQITYSGRNVMLAVDLSASMQLEDMQLNGQAAMRLEIVKDTAQDFIQKRQGDRLGLILFGSKAYLQTPLTYDRTTVLHMLDDATIGLAGQNTAIGDAIGLAIKRLQDTPHHSSVLILLTDGANNSGVISPLKAAQIAKQQGIKIYTIGIGASRLLVRSLFGSQLVNPSAELDEPTLKKIASLTGGQFFRAHNTAELQQVYHSIDQLEPILIQQDHYRPIVAYYYWPLAVAWLLFLMLLWQPRCYFKFY